jgi:hypothetical protein
MVAGPTPRDSGSVSYWVEVDGRRVEISVSPLGIGVGGDVELATANKALLLVKGVVSGQRDELQRLFRVAANLRRDAGKPRPIGTTPAGSARVALPPEKLRDGVSYTVDVDGVEIRVAVFAEGGLVDDCDDWDRATDQLRDRAFSAVLDHLLSDSSDTSGLGLDIDLLRDLWG